jgi:hypothetical protein
MVMVWKSNLYGVQAPAIEWGQGVKAESSGVMSSPADPAATATGTEFGSRTPLATSKVGAKRITSKRDYAAPTSTASASRRAALSAASVSASMSAPRARAPVLGTLGTSMSVSQSQTLQVQVPQVQQVQQVQVPYPTYAYADEAKGRPASPSRIPNRSMSSMVRPGSAGAGGAGGGMGMGMGGGMGMGMGGGMGMHSSTPMVAHTSDQMPVGLARTLDHIVGQLDLLGKTMGVMEERLTLTESRVSSIISMQRTSMQKRDEVTQGAPMPPVPPVSVPVSAPMSSMSASMPMSASASAPAPPADLQTIQLRVMCRQKGIDASGSQLDLLRRLNETAAAGEPAYDEEEEEDDDDEGEDDAEDVEEYNDSDPIEAGQYDDEEDDSDEEA